MIIEIGKFFIYAILIVLLSKILLAKSLRGIAENLKFKTLKDKPEISGPSYEMDKRNSTFTLSITNVVDSDNGIEGLGAIEKMENVKINSVFKEGEKVNGTPNAGTLMAAVTFYTQNEEETENLPSPAGRLSPSASAGRAAKQRRRRAARRRSCASPSPQRRPAQGSTPSPRPRAPQRALRSHGRAPLAAQSGSPRRCTRSRL